MRNPGLPARVLEIMSIRRSSRQNYERTDKIYLIQRFLPGAVGAPLLQYICLALRFLESTEAVMPDGEGGPAKEDRRSHPVPSCTDAVLKLQCTSILNIRVTALASLWKRSVAQP